MKARITRLCIYPKDIQRITGKSERYSRDLIHKIRDHLQKPDFGAICVKKNWNNFPKIPQIDS